MSTGKASAKLCTNQTLTASYADTSTIGSFSISEESIATLDIIYTTGAAETNNSLQFQLSFSHNGIDWVTETYSSLSSGMNTLAPLEHSVAGAAAGTAYKAQYVVPFCSRYLKVQIKETGVAANFGTATIVLTVAAASGQERNVQASAAPAGGATEDKQDDQIALETTIAGDTTSIDGKITACNTGAVVLTAGTSLIGKASVGQDTASIYNGTTALTPKYAIANIAASQTDSNIVTAVAGKKIRVHQVVAITGGTATNVTFNTKPAGAGTAISPIFAHGVNGGEVLPFSPMGWFETASGEGLTATTGAGSASGFLIGYTEV
jgi:hypothetical protein